MTRIIGGSARGRRLAVPSQGTRPTSDRAREAVFSSLESLRGPFDGSAVLDLYAGSGALGLEAWSRGADRVELVESDRAAAAVVRENVRVVVGDHPPTSVRVQHLTVQHLTVQRWLSRAEGSAPFDVVFCDPPYATSDADVAACLRELVDRELLAGDALVVVERSARDEPWAWPASYEPVRDRAYGEAHLWIGRVAP